MTVRMSPIVADSLAETLARRRLGMAMAAKMPRPKGMSTTATPLVTMPAMANPLPPYKAGERLAFTRAMIPNVNPSIAPTPRQPKLGMLRIPRARDATAMPCFGLRGELPAPAADISFPRLYLRLAPSGIELCCAGGYHEPSLEGLEDPTQHPTQVDD